jgi:hypothetical protein
MTFLFPAAKVAFFSLPHKLFFKKSLYINVHHIYIPAVYIQFYPFTIQFTFNRFSFHAFGKLALFMYFCRQFLNI